MDNFVSAKTYRLAAWTKPSPQPAQRELRLVLWSETSPVASWYQPLEVWKAWSRQVRGRPIAAGHFLPEEAPDRTARYLTEFLAQPRPGNHRRSSRHDD
jgi:hypothetical protein